MSKKPRTDEEKSSLNCHPLLNDFQIIKTGGIVGACFFEALALSLSKEEIISLVTTCAQHNHNPDGQPKFREFWKTVTAHRFRETMPISLETAKLAQQLRFIAAKRLTEQWKTSIKTQQQFDDLITRLRAASIEDSYFPSFNAANEAEVKIDVTPYINHLLKLNTGEF